MVYHSMNNKPTKATKTKSNKILFEIILPAWS